ncbi:hypothetical protein Fmac_021373 [Flemingia macrophylla]|uniref:Sesquiterpene synthase n=1 Tax=Flemingia macrophylla TaxID=520843 RepID=A0ABD1LWR4_9FABA
MSGSPPVFAKDAKPPSEFRPIADYHPSVWGDHFISYISPSHSNNTKIKGREHSDAIVTPGMVLDKWNDDLRILDCL